MNEPSRSNDPSEPSSEDSPAQEPALGFGAGAGAGAVSDSASGAGARSDATGFGRPTEQVPGGSFPTHVGSPHIFSWPHSLGSTAGSGGSGRILTARDLGGRRPRRIRLPILLFLITCASTFWAGATRWQPLMYIGSSMDFRRAILRNWS